MNYIKNKQYQSLRRTRVITVLIAAIAVIAILLSVYAFNQKKEADEQAALAKRNITEALQQQKIALEQRNIADSNKEQALQQRELALESERRALLQSKIANEETRKATQSRLEALRQQYLAEQQKLNAAVQTKIAETSTAEAKKQQGFAEMQRMLANDQKQISSRLKELETSRKMATESVMMLNEHLYDSSRSKALEAYLLNRANNGPEQNNDIYGALNINWVKSIGNRNQVSLHKLPVHAVTGIPNTNIVFTADEDGMLYEYAVKNSGMQRMAVYPVKEEVRALAVSEQGNKLVAITTLGNGFVFKITSPGLSLINEFKFPGIGKAVAFDGGGNIMLASSKGVGKYPADDLSNAVFLNYDGISAFAAGGSGRLYIAFNNYIKVYTQWDDLVRNVPASIRKFDSKVSVIAVDNAEQFMAAGTYNGVVWISSLKTNTVLWSRALHISNVNDLKFGMVNNNKLQLASAGADQTIKLTDVYAVIQRNAAEDILALKGHSKWVYALYYAQDGRWLCSAGEDSKVIAWRPTMYDLYQSLTDN